MAKLSTYSSKTTPVDADSVPLVDSEDSSNTKLLSIANLKVLIASVTAGLGAYVAGGTDVAVADGGTGASTASAARTNLDAAKTNLVGSPIELGIAASDESTAITTGTGKVTFRMPCAMTVTAVRSSLSTAQTSGSIFTVDINEAGTTILSTKLTIDNTEKTSTTAATAPVISDAALADDAEITVDVDQVGDGTAKGLKVWLIGTRA